MLKPLIIGVCTPLLLCIGPAEAQQWNAPISGAKPILPSRFTPFDIQSLAEPGDAASVITIPGRWSLPLVDRNLSQIEKAAPLQVELQEAINRIVPIYDPTRLGALDDKGFWIHPGTAWMTSVFGDRWRIASDDPNVDARVAYSADAWTGRDGPVDCDFFTKSRAHDFRDPTLDALDEIDCLALQRRAARGFPDAAPLPIVAAAISVPVFAAPLPGARLASGDFWAAQKERIRAIEARIAEQRRHRDRVFTEAGLRR